MNQPSWRLSTALFLILASSAAHAGDFVDTRLSFVFSDDNLLAGPGETLQNSPEIDFGPRDGLFFPLENINRQDTGDETLAHLVLYKKLEGYIPGLITEAAFVARMEVLDSPGVFFRAGDVNISDGGSYIRAAYILDGENDDDSERKLELIFYPMNADRFRAGYTFDLSWGGNAVFTDRNARFASPGFKFRAEYDGFYGFAGAKTTRQLILEEDPTEVSNRELGAFWGGLFGAGWFGESVGVELSGGIFDAGRIPKQGIQGKTVMAGGGSFRLSYFLGDLKPSTSIDFRLYRNDTRNLNETNFFLRQPKTYTELALRVQLEGSILAQTLGDFDNPLSTKLVPAMAFAAQLDGFYGNFGFSLDAVYRDLNFVLFNVPSLDPFLSFPSDSQQTPEILVAAQVDYWIESLHLLPRLLLGVQVPATYRGRIPETTNAGGLAGAEQTVVIPAAGTIIAFPDGTAANIVPSVRASLRFDLSDMVSLIGQVTYLWDNNQLGRTRDEVTQTAIYQFKDPNILGVSIFAIARF